MEKTRIIIVASALIYAGAGSTAPQLGGCPLFPPDNIWNVAVDRAPLDHRSTAYIQSIGVNTGLHPDFGAGQWDGGPIGIPFNIVPGATPEVPVDFAYADESDPGPYPIPGNPAIEGGPAGQGDRHVLVVDQGTCTLYELFYAFPLSNGSWEAGSGAVFDLRSNALRPAGWTSADAAGLPVLAGLARCEEMEAGVIEHALRFTAQRTQRKYVWPARHFASSITDPDVPPMGQRFRLKAAFDISHYSAQTRIVLEALKTYGMILADNGSNWYISGAPGSCWDDDTLVSELRTVTGDAFEAVNVADRMVDPDSGATRAPTAGNDLTVSKLGDGLGTITSTPAGIACGETCSARFATGSSVGITATPAAGSSFVAWSEGCSGSAPTVNVVLGSDTQCDAEFALQIEAADLAVKLSGPTTIERHRPRSFRVAAKNLGPTSSTETRVKVRLPRKFRFVSASSGCSHRSRVITCDLGTVPNGVAIHKRIRVHATAKGAYSIESHASATTADPQSANNLRTLRVRVK